MTKQAGEIVAGHELLEQIGCDGAGGFGLGYLWKARNPTGRLVALKMASPMSLPLLRIKERNQHPNLVQLYGYWVFDESQYGLAIATDVLIRTPIRRRLEECRAEGQSGIPQEELLARIEDIANAVDFLNMPKYIDGFGMVANQPCDVTPNDILVRVGKAILDDIHTGVYELPSPQEKPKRSVDVPPAYSAPECWDRSRCTASSQYSLAVTYHELRTGALPFRDFPPKEGDWSAILKQRKLDLSQLPAAERRVLKKGLAHDPKDRYGSCVELVRCLRSACQA